MHVVLKHENMLLIFNNNNKQQQNMHACMPFFGRFDRIGSEFHPRAEGSQPGGMVGVRLSV
jgi:hypothetical protein